MAFYRIVFRSATRGNTTVDVEDLGRSGTVCTHCTRGEYPGVCEHCGKLHIRYLAHVKQDLADTLLRATSPDVDNPIERDDMEIANLGIALLARQTNKEVAVGCVCVSKYLVDCGVDEGLAQRFQFQVGRVTGYLQQLAAMEAAKSDDRLTESVRRAAVVERLRKRYSALRSIRTYQNPKFKDAAFAAEFSATVRQAQKDYDEARERWQRENFGWNLYYKSEPTASALDSYFDAKIAHCNRKLRVYSNSTGVTFNA
jgi:hypothetical protein